jgi:hypothetical protein
MYILIINVPNQKFDYHYIELWYEGESMRRPLDQDHSECQSVAVMMNVGT